MIMHQIEALVKVGVDEVILAVNYQPEVMLSAMKAVEAEYKVKITFSIEGEPLGTAGPLGLVRDVLEASDQPFFVLNSDVICPFPFQKLVDFHRAHGGEGTILTTPVTDPSKYGVVLCQPESSEIARFVEKPKNYVGNQINAGIYILSPSVLKRIHPRPMSIEKDVFPHMAAAGTLHAVPLEGFWADVGQPADFLTGMALYLDSIHANVTSANQLDPSVEIIGPVMIDPSATIAPNCKIGPNVVIGPDAHIQRGVRLSHCVAMRGSVVKDHACVRNSIVGWYSSVGRWSRLENVTVLGEDVHVADEVYVNGGSVLPHKSVGANILTPQIVM
ncbi:GDP-D-mannose pyrophosphorylase [Caulochytrium protostelioides]|nr:GDP-D-mannose pyrophosphorylase [Caulochytrium protostelioides]